MFLHGGWDRILGNMLFLAIFGKNVEDAFRSLAYLVVFYFAAMMTQTAMTLLFGPAQAVRVPELGASGAVAAVLGAHFVLYPDPQILTYIFPGLAWRSSPTSAGSSSACWWHGSLPGRDRQHPGSNGDQWRSLAGSSSQPAKPDARRGHARRRRIGYSQSCHKLSAMMKDSLR
jgi:hypothetical protein